MNGLGAIETSPWDFEQEYVIVAKWGGQPCSDNAGAYGFLKQKYYTNWHNADAIVSS